MIQSDLSVLKVLAVTPVCQLVFDERSAFFLPAGSDYRSDDFLFGSF